MKRLTKISIIGFIAVLLALTLGLRYLQSYAGNGFIPLRVAHAGGGIDGRTYTNSYQALDANLRYGFRYFEMDFSYTSDGRLVCIHDWVGTFQRLFGYESLEPLTYDEFVRRSKSLKYEPCTVSGLAAWMQANPGTKIVTDLKERNAEGLELLLQALPDAKSRVIPQIYLPQEYQLVKGMGFEQIIWTLYRYQGSAEQVLSWVDSFTGPIAVTMPKAAARSGLPAQLAKRRIPTYVHTVNDSGEAQRFIQTFQLNEIYTDFLRP